MGRRGAKTRSRRVKQVVERHAEAVEAEGDNAGDDHANDQEAHGFGGDAGRTEEQDRPGIGNRRKGQRGAGNLQ